MFTFFRIKFCDKICFNMNKRRGEKLFTIQFSSSSDESDDLPPPRSPQNSVNKPVILLNLRTRQIPKEKPDLGGLIEISDSYYEYSDHAKPLPKNKQDFAVQQKIIDSNETKNENIPTDNNNKHNSDFGSEIDITPNNNNINNTNTPKKTEDDSIEIDETSKIDQNNENSQDSDDYQPFHVKPPPRQSLPVHLPPQEEVESKQPTKPDFPIYLIKREKKTHLNGRRIFFNFYLGEQQIYTAKCKTKTAHHVYIAKGNEAHLKSTSDAVILVGNDSSDFSLRKQEDLGNEILTVRILPPKTSADKTRRMTISFFNPLEGTPNKVFSKNPNLNPDGKVEHDFQGRFSIESVKNAVLVSKIEGQNMLYIRKTGSNEIEIEPKFKHDMLWIFAIGIASFMSKVKGSK